MNEKLARTAAKWWADQLRNGARLDNGDDSETGGTVAVMAALLQGTERRGRTEEQIDKFESALAKIIVDYNLTAAIKLGVDYHPCRNLRQAAEEAGLDLGMASLPWKTTMWVTNDRIELYHGYGAKMQVLATM